MRFPKLLPKLRRPRRADEPRRKISFTGRAAVLAVVLAALSIALAGPLRQLISQRAELASLRADVKAGQQRVKDLEKQHELWADPSYVAQQARERLHYVKPGEVPYVTLGPTPRPTAGTVGGTPVAQEPWYAQLWSSIEGAAATPSPAPAATPSPGPATESSPSPSPAP